MILLVLKLGDNPPLGTISFLLPTYPSLRDISAHGLAVSRLNEPMSTSARGDAAGRVVPVTLLRPRNTD